MLRGILYQQARTCGAKGSAGALAPAARDDTWLGPDQKIDQPDTWTAANLKALGSTYRLLLHEFNCVESAHADPEAGDVVDERDSDS